MKRVVLRQSVRIFRRTARGSGSLVLTHERIPSRSVIGLDREEKVMSYGNRIKQAVLFDWQGYLGYVLVEEIRYLEIVK